MAKRKYDILSPDGFPITCEPFRSKTEARLFVPLWCARFKAQGYYSTANHYRIPLRQLRAHLTLVETDETVPRLCKCPPRLT